MNYECLRCSFQTKQKNDLRRHINKKKICKVVLLDVSRNECLKHMENVNKDYMIEIMKNEIVKIRQTNVIQEKEIKIIELHNLLNNKTQELKEVNEKLKIQQEEIDSLKLSQVRVVEEQNECVYLLLEREFITSGSGNKIYKFGRSKCLKNRMNSYPKNSDIVYTTPCNNSVKVERDILVLFNVMFKQRTDIGTEYFEGNEKRMIATIRNYMFEQ
jgi:hypothetical protein